MKFRSRVLLALSFLALAIAAVEIQAGRPQEPVAAPARVTPMLNFEIDAAKSGRPASVPAAWGRLAEMQNLGNGNHVLVFESQAGDLYFVRLIQRGSYLHLDTRDQGGVVIVLARNRE